MPEITDEEYAALRAQAAAGVFAERKGKVDERIEELKEIGLSEFPGFLKEVRAILLSDDGGAATVELSEDGKPKTELTATDIVNRLIDALPRDDKQKIALGEKHVKDEEGARPPAELDESGKPKDELTTAQKADAIRAEWPEINRTR